MNLGIKNKVAIVTGGSTGIGLATAQLFLQEGCRVAICARDEARLQTAAAELQPLGDVLAYPCDVLKVEQVQAFVAATVARFGGIDILVNNAGHGRVTTFAQTDDQMWHDELEIKFFGVIHPIRAAYPYLKAAGNARIININAVLARQPEPHMVATSAARAGLLNLTHSLAIEFAPDNILVNSITLGTVESEQWHRRYQTAIENGSTTLSEPAWITVQAAQRQVPLGRFGKPTEVAAAIAFLASSHASFITGTALEVAGGVSRYV